MNYFITPNIILTTSAENKAKTYSISDNEIYSTVNSYDHSENIDYNTYKRRKKFSGSQVLIYCKWQDSKQQWLVTFCIKRNQ